MVDAPDVSGWMQFLQATKGLVDLLKAIRDELPNSKKRVELERQIQEAEKGLKLSEAKIAAELGYKICDCTFPPQIMLRREKDGVRVCPNPECGRKTELYSKPRPRRVVRSSMV